jgi:hypothetical protein
VSVGVLVGVPANFPCHDEGCLLLGWVLDGAVERVGLVVRRGVGALVSVHIHRAVSLVVGNSRLVRAVDRDLVVVGSKSVSLSIRVREESSLKHLVV